MKSLFLIVLSLVSASAFAETPKCANKIAKQALYRINHTDGFDGDSADTRSIYGVKPLFMGAFSETYVIAVSDEVEPSEWVAVVDRKSCKIKFIDLANDGAVSDLFE